MSDMTEDFTPTEQLVLEVLQARCVRLGEEQWYFDDRFKSVLRRLEARGFIGFQTHVQGAQAVWLNKHNPAWAGFFDPRPDEFRDPARDVAAEREDVDPATDPEYPIGAFQGLAAELEAAAEPDTKLALFLDRPIGLLVTTVATVAWGFSIQWVDTMAEVVPLPASLMLALVWVMSGFMLSAWAMCAWVSIPRMWAKRTRRGWRDRYRRVFGTAAKPTTLRVLTGWACAALCVVALIAVMVGLYMIPERWQNWVALGAFALCCLGGAAMIWISASEEAMRRRHRTTGGEDR